jgi:hypothetical protein
VKLKIVPGHEVDVLSPDEARQILRELADELQPSGGSVRFMGEKQTDGNGNGTILLAPHVPIGYEFALYRLIVDDDVHSPAAPFTNANGWIDVKRNELDRVGFQGMSIPALATDGSSEAVRFRNGEKIAIVINGGPVNQLVRARGEGELKPSLRPPEEKARKR